MFPLTGRPDTPRPDSSEPAELRVRIASDLHLEFNTKRWNSFSEDLGEDLVILAGDIHQGVNGVLWARRTFTRTPVVYVLGNHEYGSNDFYRLADECRMVSAGSNVHVLENQSFDFEGFRVLGATLWTDFAVFGEGTRHGYEAYAEKYMPDYFDIHAAGRRLLATQTVERFRHSAAWLEQEIARSDRPTIVVTHHAPTLKTQHPDFIGEPSVAAYHSNLDHLIRDPVRLWIHGHTHHNADEIVNGVRVLTHQGGFGEFAPGFDPNRIFAVGRD